MNSSVRYGMGRRGPIACADNGEKFLIQYVRRLVDEQ